jgi:hypothetical protein
MAKPGAYRFRRKVLLTDSTAPVSVLVAVAELAIVNFPGSAFICFNSGPLGWKKGPPTTFAVSPPETSKLSLKPGPFTVVVDCTLQFWAQTSEIWIFLPIFSLAGPT